MHYIYTTSKNVDCHGIYIYILKLNSHDHLFSLPEVCTTLKSSHANKYANIHCKVSFSDDEVTLCTSVGKSQNLTPEVPVAEYYDNI